MAEVNEILQLARERAEKRLDTALGEIRLSMLEIAKRHRIPEGVLGHDVYDLLGRIAHSPALARDLRREAGQIMAKQELEELQSLPRPAPPPAPTRVQPAAAGQAQVPVSMAIADLNGITVAQVKVLNGAGIIQIADLVNMPDEHLAKVTQLDPKAIGKIRAAVAKASAPKA